MRKATITIPVDEYERLQQMENLTHKQRFTIAKLEKDLQRYKANASRFTDKTLQILKGTGYSFEEIMLLYEAMENICRH